ncbi:MAG: hypothetical protein ACRDX8_09280 [Acidimicrobiales bacterium]
MAGTEGTRVVLARKENSMIGYRWTEEAPPELSDLDTAEGLGASWEGPELVVYDLEGFSQLLDYHSAGGEYLIDND